MIIGPYDKKTREGRKVLCESCGKKYGRLKYGTTSINKDDNAIAQLFKCIGDTCRVKIIESLSEHELCVYEFAPIIGVQYPTISYHLKMLRELGIVESYDKGNFIVYSLTDKGVLVLGIINQSKEIIKER